MPRPGTKLTLAKKGQISATAALMECHRLLSFRGNRVKEAIEQGMYLPGDFILG